MASSELKGFYKKSLDERLAALNGFAGLSESEIALLKKYGALDFETANRMIENVYSTHALPLGVATNFKINGKDVQGENGEYLLQVAQRNGIEIPTLCNHKILEPAGLCRLCLV